MIEYDHQAIRKAYPNVDYINDAEEKVVDINGNTVGTYSVERTKGEK